MTRGNPRFPKVAWETRRRQPPHGGRLWDDRGVADDLADVADELYALPPEEFVAAREARAKQARADGDRELAAQVRELPKPTVAAWLLNQLARQRPEAVDQLVGLGDELREAQQSLDGDQMRALNQQRQQVVRAFSRQAAQLAEALERPLSDAVAQQVEETLRAAVADADAGQALLSGRLTTALSYVGMGEGSVTAAVAVPKARRSPPTTSTSRKHAKQPPPDDEVAAARERRRESARQALAEAEQDVTDTAGTLAEREQAVRELDDRQAALAERLETLRAELEEVEAEAADVDDRQQEAADARDAAAEAARKATEAVERVRGELDELG